MSISKAIKEINPNAEFSVLENDVNQITWLNGTTPISVEDINAKVAEMPTEEEEATAKETLKASAKAKLISGDPLTAEEADTIVI